MDQEDAITKARQFADTAYAVEVSKISRQFQEKLGQSRAELSRRGMLLSGYAVSETARIHAERMTTLLQGRLDLLLEGFELHHVTIDNQLMERVIRELAELRSTWIINAIRSFNLDPVLGRKLVPESAYLLMLEQNVGLGPNEIRTQIDRRRLMPKKTDDKPSVNISYHVTGHNNRWVTNSQDYSVNVVTQSADQIFANLRREIDSRVPAGEERQDILDRLTALEQAQNSPAFGRRYTEFIAAAANHCDHWSFYPCSIGNASESTSGIVALACYQGQLGDNKL